MLTVFILKSMPTAFRALVRLTYSCDVWGIEEILGEAKDKGCFAHTGVAN